MKPAFSVIFFTVFSGAGLGMFALLALLDIGGSIGAASATDAHAAIFGLALVVIGLCASTVHLANPRNAWRSFTRFRTSWLSREAVFALAFVAVASAYTAMLVAGMDSGRRAIAVAVVALA